mmetsp:Transcript_4684/g.14192  ORF Transcript_4684/g.14192 Transcript_4684/m.14192 type:complete len:391 (+) Transcript_4684:283-1455(+)
MLRLSWLLRLLRLLRRPAEARERVLQRPPAALGIRKRNAVGRQCMRQDVQHVGPGGEHDNLGVRLAGAQERQQPPHDGLEFGSVGPRHSDGSLSWPALLKFLWLLQTLRTASVGHIPAPALTSVVSAPDVTSASDGSPGPAANGGDRGGGAAGADGGDIRRRHTPTPHGALHVALPAGEALGGLFLARVQQQRVAVSAQTMPAREHHAAVGACTADHVMADGAWRRRAVPLGSLQVAQVAQQRERAPEVSGRDRAVCRKLHISNGHVVREEFEQRLVARQLQHAAARAPAAAIGASTAAGRAAAVAAVGCRKRAVAPDQLHPHLRHLQFIVSVQPHALCQRQALYLPPQLPRGFQLLQVSPAGLHESSGCGPAAAVGGKALELLQKCGQS